MKTPQEFLDLIDKKYQEARKKKISRTSLDWSMWSADMNRELRTYTEDEDSSQRELYVMVFSFWTVISQLIDIRHKGGFLSKFKEKSKLDEAMKIRREIIESIRCTT